MSPYLPTASHCMFMKDWNPNDKIRPEFNSMEIQTMMVFFTVLGNANSVCKHVPLPESLKRWKKILLDQTLVSLNLGLHCPSLQNSVLARTLLNQLRENPTTLDIWSLSISNLIPHPPPLIFDHTGLPFSKSSVKVNLARILPTLAICS